MSKRLVVLNPDQRMEIPLDQQLTIGRDFYNSLSLQDPDVSRTHAILFEHDGRATVKDLHSANGVLVNGEKVAERELADGDELVMGRTVMVFNPPEGTDPLDRLTEAGRKLLGRVGPAAAPAKPVARSSAIPAAKMHELVRQVFDQSAESARFFSSQNALSLLKVFYEMGLETDTTSLFRLALERCLELLGGDEGVVMECDDTRTRLKVLSIRSHLRDTKRIEIPQRVLDLVIREEKCVHCPDVARDPEFEHIVSQEGRSIHSFMACPITMAGDYFGFIYLHGDSPALEYDAIALRSLFLIATHLAGLLEPHPTRFSHERRRGKNPDTETNPF